MASGMHLIDDKHHVSEELWFTYKTVRSKLTSEVIYNHLRSFFPIAKDCRKYVISTLGSRHHVKSQTHKMWTLERHETSRQLLLFVGVIVLIADAFSV